MTTVRQLCVLLSLVSFVSGEEADEKGSKWGLERRSWIIEQYESSDFISAERRLWRERGATEYALLHILRISESDQTTRLIIARLADMRSEQADWPLIQRITLEDPGAFSLDNPLVRYPAAAALAKIGLPAVRSILRDRLHLPATDEELTLFAAVVHRHYILENAVGRFHVQNLLEQAQKQLEGKEDPDRYFTLWEQNLTKVLDFYDAIEGEKGEKGDGSNPVRLDCCTGGSDRQEG